jgi:hypothetical protein
VVFLNESVKVHTKKVYKEQKDYGANVSTIFGNASAEVLKYVIRNEYIDWPPASCETRNE